MYLYAGKEPLMSRGGSEELEGAGRRDGRERERGEKKERERGEKGAIASVPALERRNSGGEVELRSIIGGSALINGNLAGRVRCTHI